MSSGTDRDESLRVREVLARQNLELLRIILEVIDPSDASPFGISSLARVETLH